MPCDPPNQEWTIDTLIDAQPVADTRRLIFCLAIEGEKVTGEVKIKTSDNEVVHLSSVAGQSRALTEVISQDPARPATLMTLTFTWGTTRMVLSGNTFPVGPVNQFFGRFLAFASAATLEPAPPDGGGLPEAPGDGDTGTGTGTQT
jgi:hypothetical protein